MSNFEENLDNDLELIMGDDLGPAIEIKVISEEKEFYIQGFFEMAGEEVNMGNSISPVASVHPMLHVQERDLKTKLGRPFNREDVFIIKGKEYRTNQPIPDGFGLVSIHLIEKDRECTSFPSFQL